MALLYQIGMSVLSMADGVVGVPVAPCAVEAHILPTPGGSPKATGPGVVAIWVLDAKEGVEIPTETLDLARHDGLERKNRLCL